MQTENPDKKAWRRRQRLMARDHCPDLRGALTTALIAALESWLAERRFSTILTYQPLPDEPDIRDLARRMHGRGASIVLPKVAGDFSGLGLHLWQPGATFIHGAYGIEEPDPATWPEIAAAAIDAALIPALAFDPATGIRLGRGAGLYDRLLACPDFRATRIGIALPWHLAGPLPREPHDEPMHFLATPGGVMAPGLASGTPGCA